MSDDLVKRLRDLGDHASFEPHMHHTAADRIEELENRLEKEMSDLDAADRRITRLQARIQELEEQNKRLRLEVAHANDTADVAIERVEELEANLSESEALLAKAVEALADVYRLHLRRGPAWDHEGTKEVMDSAITTLAELTGGKDE